MIQEHHKGQCADDCDCGCALCVISRVAREEGRRQIRDLKEWIKRQLEEQQDEGR